MNIDAIKYFQYEVRIEEEVVLERFKKLLDHVNLHYVYIYNPISKYWEVFIDVNEEDLEKDIESIIKLFDEANKYIKGSEFYERSR